MLPKEELAPWLKSVMLRGYESEGEEGEAGAGGTGDAGETEGDESESGEDELANLKKALAAERLRSKNLAKQLKTKAPATTEGTDEEAEETGTDKGKAASDRSLKKANLEAQGKLERLSEGYRLNELKSTVRTIADGLNFVDWDDAYSALDRSLLSYEQDEDDPTIVVWDESEIKTALKDLAKRKPHLLKQPDGSGKGGGKTPNRPTGSKFGGTGGRPSNTDIKAQQADLARRFPAMRNVRPPQG